MSADGYLPPGVTQDMIDRAAGEDKPPECTRGQSKRYACHCPECEEAAYEAECDSRMDANREDGGSRTAPRRYRYGY